MKRLAGLLAVVILLAGCNADKRLFNKAQLAASQGKLNEAIQLYTKLVKQDPNNASAYLNRGVLWERLPVKDVKERAKNRAHAEQDYRHAIDLAPDMAQAYNNLGALYLDMGNNSDALFYLTSAITLQPNYFTALMNRAIVNHRTGRLLASIVDFNSASKIKQDDPVLLLNRSLAFFDLGNYEDAVKDLTYLLVLDPNNARAHLERARSLIELGFPADAYTDLEQAATLQPSYALAYYYMGDLLFRRGDTNAGLGMLVKAKELASHYVPTYELMGDMLSLEDPVAATANYMVAKKLDPSNARRYNAKIKLMKSTQGRERVFANRFYQK